jgi:hypothetical protein
MAIKQRKKKALEKERNKDTRPEIITEDETK